MERESKGKEDRENIPESPVERNLKRIFGQMSFEKSNVYEAGTRNDGEESMDR